MAETDAKLHYGLLYIVFPAVAVLFILNRFCGFNKVTFKALIFNSLCRYVHWVCRREKVLLFEQLKDFRNRSKENTFTLLEIGVGSGLNFKFFPYGSEVTGLDPDPNSEKCLMDSFKKAKNNVKFVQFIKGFAENMNDIPSDSFDAVVCTFTMCSIEKLDEALEEIRRVLKPGGRFFFLEHVASEKGTSLRFIQNILQRIMQFFFHHHHHHHHHHHGNINRETGSFLDESKFKDVQYCHFTAKTWLAFFAKPCIYGSAVK